MKKIFSTLIPFALLLAACYHTPGNMAGLNKQIATDTAGVYLAPVKVISAQMITEKYINTKKVQVLFKNLGEDMIERIRFYWYEADADTTQAGTPAVYSLGDGFIDEITGPHEDALKTQQPVSPAAQTVIIAWPYEVDFSNGSVWKLK